MKREQLSHRIGNIEDRLVEQAENAPNFGQVRRNRNIRRMVSIAAVLVLMVASFAMGAIALAKETVIYIEKEQEIITVGDSGISLILPDTWKGKYGYKLRGNTVEVYHLASREAYERAGIPEQGTLFYVEYDEILRPLDYEYMWPGFTIAVTENGTFYFRTPSDSQYLRSDPVSAAEYQEMSSDDIEIVMSAQMLQTTMNSTNWIKGMVFVHYLEDIGYGATEVRKSVTCDMEQSRIIREIVESQDYSLEQGSFPYDLIIMVDGQEYYLNSTTGNIRNAAEYPYGTVMSTEDLSRIMDLLLE